MADELWSHVVGTIPHKVTVFENADRGRTLYLRWRATNAQGKRNWEVESLEKRLRTANGRIIKTVHDDAIAAATKKYAELVAGLTPEEKPKALPLTILDGLAKAIAPKTGLYPKDSAHRREVIRELNHAARILVDDRGNVKTFNAITKSTLVALWRTRHEELTAAGQVGVRGAEITVSRLLTVAEWLRGDNAIVESACKPWKDWKAQLRAEVGSPEPFRPRHTLEEALAVLRVADQVDPRLGLALALGAELRGGQVIRCRRSDLTLELDVEANRFGTLTVKGRGKKRGTVVHLTRGQRAAVDRALGGYLRELEATGKDYPLFPSGKLHGWRAVGGERVNGRRIGFRMEASVDMLAPAERADASSLNRGTIDGWFWEAEDLAGVVHVKGRSWYGMRRVFVDASSDAGISPEGLQEQGGWADRQVPDRIYRDKERSRARDEARDVRARVRGEDEA